MMGFGNGGFWQYCLIAAGVGVVFALLAWGIYAVTRTPRKTFTEEPNGAPLAILNERLVRGEVEPDEYKKLRNLIAEANNPPGDTRLW